MPPRTVSAADVVAEAVRVETLTRGRTAFIGIDGLGAAGKTTLAARIAAAVDRVVVVRIDDFARPDVPEWEWDRFDEQVLSPLLRGVTARYQVWDWAADTGRDWIDVAPGQVVVVEGVSCTRREVRIDWDLTVWVDAPRDVRLRRAIERDGLAMLDTWLTRWLPPEEAYVAREQPQQRVQLLVDGTVDARDLGQ